MSTKFWLKPCFGYSANKGGKVGERHRWSGDVSGDGWGKGTCIWCHRDIEQLRYPAASAAEVGEGWQPMRTAPKDGTAVLVLVDGSDIPRAVRWLKDDDARMAGGAPGWYMTWDGCALTDNDGPRYWMPCLDDPDEAAVPKPASIAPAAPVAEALAGVEACWYCGSAESTCQKPFDDTPCRRAPAAAGSAEPASSGGASWVDIVFDGPPGHQSGRFVEVEDAAGKSIKFGNWVQRADGYWVLRIGTQPTAGEGGAESGGAAPSDLFKSAMWLHTSWIIHRYLMSNAKGRENGAEKAQRHRELVSFYVATVCALSDIDAADRERTDECLAVHEATQELTSYLDEAIGFPLDRVPDYEALAPKFFERFHELAMAALAQPVKPVGGSGG